MPSDGKPLAVARAADVELAADIFHYMSGWVTKLEGNTIPRSVPYMPGGIPASRISSPRNRADSGVCSAGLRTIVTPAASAGASFHAAIRSGKFHGMIWPTTDRVSRVLRDPGLASGIWTSDLSKAHRLAERLRAGTVWINCYNVFDASLPFGGFKECGWGREMGHDALELYTEVKSVCIQL